MKNLLLAALVLSLFNSCVIVNTPGFYSGYKKLPDNEKAQVLFADYQDPVCNKANDKKIYAITGVQLLQCLQANDTSVVYIWSPNCHSDVCITLNAAQYFCNKNGYKLYVVMQYYDFQMLNKQRTDGQAVYTINHKFYGTDYCNKYVRLFTKDIIGDTKQNKDDKYNRFLFFKKNKLIFTRNSLIKKNGL